MTTYNGASVVVRHSSGTFAASGLLREIQPQTSFPATGATKAVLNDLGIAPRVLIYASLGDGQKYGAQPADSEGSLVDGEWVVTIPAVDKDSGELAADLAAAIATRQTAIDAQRDALLAAGKTISGKTYDGSIGTIGGMTVSRERTGRLAGALTKVITNITQANPGVITSAVHGIPTGQWVLVEDIVGMTELNDNTYVAESLSGTTLKLKTLAGRDINTTSFTAYTSGGTLKTVVPYITVDNETVYLDYATAVTVIDTLTEWHNSMYLQGRSHKNAVAALSTVAAVEAYDSDSWPT